MQAGAQTTPDGSRRFGRLRLMVIAIILVGLAAAGFFTAQLSEKIVELREVPRDNVQWNTAQLEVDFLKLRAALDAALDEPEQLDQFRKQYDIFYSRVKVLHGATSSLPIDNDIELRADRFALDHFLMQTVPLIDASDEDLRAALPGFNAKLDTLSDTPRRFALGTLQVMANISDAQRLEIIDLLRLLAFATLTVIGALVITLATMTYQRMELSRRAGAIVQAGRMRDSTLRASLDGIIVIDEKGQITDFNGSAEKVFGYARDEVLGKRLADTIVPPAFRDAHTDGFSKYTTPDKSGIVDQGRLELTALHKDGHEFPIEISISETQGENGPNFVSYIRDITAEKLAKAELQQARDDALTAFREKSHFFAVMSHEMRTPLNGIMSALDLMRDDPITSRQERYVAIAESSSQVLLSHIDDVLLIERLDSGEIKASLEQFRPVQLVDDLADSMQPLSGRQNTALVTRHSGPDVSLYGQSRALRQVVMNLLSNAIKFTPSGKVTVSTDATTDGEAIILTIEVADTGIGISEADQKRIFQDFVTIDSAYERTSTGTGLGLGIVRRLVEQMDGEVTCESAPDQGTVFRVSLALPRADLDETAGHTPEGAPEAPQAEALDILVVEDNPINAEVLEAMLRREGHEVSHASDGFEGVHLASRTCFDLILMDVSMPNMNGIKATQEIRASRGLSKNSPIYAVTAHAMPKEVDDFMAAGMAGCILKPINADALRKMLAEVASSRSEGGPAEVPAAQAQIAAPTPDLVDFDTLANISDLLGRETFETKLAAFEAESETTVQDILAARDNGDIATLQRHAHRLAGSCGVFGATALHGALQSLEAFCKSGDGAAACEAATGVEATWVATRAVLRKG